MANFSLKYNKYMEVTKSNNWYFKESRPHMSLLNGAVLYLPTGELLLTPAARSGIAINYSSLYHDFGIEVCKAKQVHKVIALRTGTDPRKVKLTTPDGVVVVKSNLRRESTYGTNQLNLVVDFTRGEIYGLGDVLYNYETRKSESTLDEAKLPYGADYACMYYANDKVRPVSAPVDYSVPAKLNKEQRKRKQEFITLCKATVALDPRAQGNWQYSDLRKDMAQAVEEVLHGDEPVSTVLNSTRDLAIGKIARYGLPTRNKGAAKYLKFTVGGDV